MHGFMSPKSGYTSEQRKSIVFKHTIERYYIMIINCIKEEGGITYENFLRYANVKGIDGLRENCPFNQ